MPGGRLRFLTLRALTRVCQVVGLVLLLSIVISPSAFGQAIYLPDCNDPDSGDHACAHPTQAIIDAAHADGYEYYIGHAEPTAKFWSSAGASGNNMMWKFKLPATDPAPNQTGTSVANFELDAAHWVSMSLCDPQSFPFGPCTPNSDANTAAGAGSALLELQFFPPGSPFTGSGSCSATQWCVLLHINTLQQFTACKEPTTSAFVTTTGAPAGPKLFLNNGDTIVVTLHDTASGLRVDVTDSTTSGTGFMVASGANGFVHNKNQTDCTTEAFDFHPEYMTAAPGNFTAWTSLNANVAFDFEIGHWELCSDSTCTTNPDPTEQASVGACSTVRGIGGCTDSDTDHDGTSYLPDYADGTAGHPASIIISSPSNNGIGPLSAATTGGSTYTEGYKTIAFRTTEGTNGAFYPFYSQAGTGANCVLNFGNDIPGTTTNDFGKATQYGTSVINPCFPATAVAPVLSKSFTPATVQLGGTSTLTFTIMNANASSLTGIGFTDTLPAGVTVATSSGTACGGILTTTFPSSITLSGATLLAGAQCQFTLTVTGGGLGINNNVTGKIISDESLDGNPATASLTVVAPPTISKSFAAPKKVIPGGFIALSFTVGNPNSFAPLPGVGFIDTLPAGLVVNTPNGLTGSCGGGTITAVAGSNSISLANATLAASTSCTFSVNVTAATDGIYVNTTGPVFSVYGSGGTATDTLIVATPPRLTKSFGGILTLLPGGTTGLAFTLTNPNSVVTLNGLTFTDTLPPGLLVSTPNGLTGSCDGGTITATAGTNLVTLTGASLAPGASCAFTVNVIAANVELGLLTNTTSTVTSIEALPGGAAAASIFVGNPFQVRSASNLAIGDSVVNITDTGTSSTNAFPSQNGNLCVNVYTFSPDEQLIACCSCPVTPDGLNSLSARNDLISDTLTPGVPTSIVIKLLASTGVPACDASTVTGANMLATGLAAWGTTIHALPVTVGSPATTYGVTETPFRPSTLSAAELRRITTLCGFIQTNGSGFGICKSCRFGGLGVVQQ